MAQDWFKQKDHMHIVHSKPSDCLQSLCRQSKIPGHESDAMKGENSAWIPVTIKTASFSTTRWKTKRLQLNFELITALKLPLDTFYFSAIAALCSCRRKGERRSDHIMYNTAKHTKQLSFHLYASLLLLFMRLHRNEMNKDPFYYPWSTSR